MKIGEKIRNEERECNINREAAKIWASSSGRIHNYEFLTCEEIIQFDQNRIIEQAKFTYSPLAKAFERQIKTFEDKGIKQKF